MRRRNLKYAKFILLILFIVSLWSSEYILLNLMVHILGTSENMGIFVDSYSCASCNRMYTICSKILTWIRDFWEQDFFLWISKIEIVSSMIKLSAQSIIPLKMPPNPLELTRFNIPCLSLQCVQIAREMTC